MRLAALLSVFALSGLATPASAADRLAELIWRYCPASSDGLAAVEPALAKDGWSERPAPPPMPRIAGAQGRMFASPAGDAVFAIYTGQSSLPPLLGKVYACYAIPTTSHAVATKDVERTIGFAPTTDAEGISRWFFLEQGGSRVAITADVPRETLSAAMGEGRYGLFEVTPLPGTSFVSLYRPAK